MQDAVFHVPGAAHFSALEGLNAYGSFATASSLGPMLAASPAAAEAARQKRNSPFRVQPIGRTGGTNSPVS